MKPFNKEKADSKKMNPGDWAFHGDVILECIESLPENFEQMKVQNDDCLAYGEATGHLHQLSDGDFDLRIDPENPSNRYLKVVRPVSLRHQEHREIRIYEGFFKTRIQREYDPFEKKIREVAD